MVKYLIFEDVEKNIAYNTLGSVIHETLKDFYGPMIGQFLTVEYLESLNDQNLSYNKFAQCFDDLLNNRVSALEVSEQFKDEAEKVLSWSYQMLNQHQ